MNKKTTRIFGLGFAMIAVSMLIAVPAMTKDRRLSPSGNCQETNGTSNVTIDAAGVMYTQSSSAAVSCGIPSDSYFTHRGINTINVHVWNKDGSISARPYLADWDSSSYYAPSQKSTTATGFQVLSWNSTDLSTWDDSTYASWSSTVWVSLGAGDTLRLIWVSE